jgi:hypothetical protein
MKKLIILISITFLFVFKSYADIPGKVFSSTEIKKLAGAYLENNLSFDNPVFVDVDKDGDFDAFRLDDGNVEYYRNTGSLELPVFVLENRNYDRYDAAFFIDPKVPYPLFFADFDGDNDLDIFVVRDKEFNRIQNKFDYKIAAAENSLNLDTGTLLTIILVLIIVILILAILGK